MVSSLYRVVSKGRVAPPSRSLPAPGGSGQAIIKIGTKREFYVKGSSKFPWRLAAFNLTTPPSVALITLSLSSYPDILVPASPKGWAVLGGS